MVKSVQENPWDKHTELLNNVTPHMFDKDEYATWNKEWQNMPEFVQQNKKPYAQIIFRFSNEQDLQNFAKLIGQKLTKRTKSAWYPQIIRGWYTGKKWTDEP